MDDKSRTIRRNIARILTFLKENGFYQLLADLGIKKPEFINSINGAIIREFSIIPKGTTPEDVALLLYEIILENASRICPGYDPQQSQPCTNAQKNKKYSEKNLTQYVIYILHTQAHSRLMQAYSNTYKYKNKGIEENFLHIDEKILDEQRELTKQIAPTSFSSIPRTKVATLARLIDALENIGVLQISPREKQTMLNNPISFDTKIFVLLHKAINNIE